jgi:hypothetical protein
VRFLDFIFFVEVEVMVFPDPRPSPKNCGFLVRERKLGVSGRGGGYIGFGLDFWEPSVKMTENARKAPKVAGMLGLSAIRYRWGALDV